jgi:hypothetical protein
MDTHRRRLFPAAIVILWLLGVGCLLAAPRVVSLADAGDFLVRYSARLALLWWAGAVVLLIRRNSLARLTWTLACIVYVLHVGIAFQEAHHWSHAAAYRHVEEVSGFGEGIFVSYAFTLIWLADAAWWWIDHRGYESRPRWIGWSVHGFMVFVIFNATVVFESGATRWVGAAMLLLLAATWLRSETTNSSPSS